MPRRKPANDDRAPISLGDLAKGLGITQDEMLQRLARVLAKRQDAEPPESSNAV